jgi:hypothetical protein
MWKTATAVLGALLVVTNAWWLYVAIDHAVTKSYRDQVLFEQSNRVLALSALADEFVRGLGRDEAMALLQKTQPGQTPYEKDGALNTFWVSLLLEEGKVARVLRGDSDGNAVSPSAGK